MIESLIQVHQIFAVSQLESGGLNASAPLALRVVEISKADGLAWARTGQICVGPQRKILICVEHQVAANHAGTICETIGPKVALGHEEQLGSMDRARS